MPGSGRRKERNNGRCLSELKGTSGISAGRQEGLHICWTYGQVWPRTRESRITAELRKQWAEENRGNRYSAAVPCGIQSEGRDAGAVRAFFEDEENGIPEKGYAYIQGKFDKIQEKLPEIDEMINTTARLDDLQNGKVDLTIIRLAVYEIKFDEEVTGQRGKLTKPWSYARNLGRMNPLDL